MKFKVGDTVKIIGTSTNSARMFFGKTTKIKEVRRGGYYILEIEDLRPGGPGGVWPSDISPILIQYKTILHGVP